MAMRWSVRIVLGAAAIAAALITAPAPSFAQQLQVTRIQDLSFGALLAGSTAAVPPASPEAGKFTVRGVPNRPVVITFALPTLLHQGGATLPVTFGAASAAWSPVDDVSTATYFNPALPLSVDVPPGGRTIYIWIGGQVGTNPQQLPGGYAGPLVITAVTS
jgi:hypothetical protein